MTRYQRCEHFRKCLVVSTYSITKFENTIIFNKPVTCLKLDGIALWFLNNWRNSIK